MRERSHGRDVIRGRLVTIARGACDLGSVVKNVSERRQDGIGFLVLMRRLGVGTTIWPQGSAALNAFSFKTKVALRLAPRIIQAPRTLGFYVIVRYLK